MKEKTENSTKRRKLLHWLIPAALLLIVAAVTLGLVFGLRGSGNQLADNPPPSSDNQQPSDSGDKPSGGGTVNPPEGGDTDVSSKYEFIVPVKDVRLIKSHEFNWDNTMKWYRLHQAMDFGAEAGTEVLAAVDGKILSIVKDDVLDYAVIEIQHEGNVKTVYKFIDPDENLKAGDAVSRGQVIGRVAVASGAENADGDHLHFEVWRENKPADPDEYLNLSSK